MKKTTINDEVKNCSDRIRMVELQLSQLVKDSKENSLIIKSFAKKEEPKEKLIQCVSQYKKLEKTLIVYRAKEKSLNNQLLEKINEVNNLKYEIEVLKNTIKINSNKEGFWKRFFSISPK